jgi:hypothetical protein
VDFDISEFSRGLFCDGGIDMSDISEKTILELLRGNFDGTWENVAFSFSELLAFYSVSELNSKQIVNWVFSAFVIREAIRKGKKEWEFIFEILMSGLYKVMQEIELEDSIYILSYIFSNSHLSFCSQNITKLRIDQSEFNSSDSIGTSYLNKH